MSSALPPSSWRRLPFVLAAVPPRTQGNLSSGSSVATKNECDQAEPEAAETAVNEPEPLDRGPTSYPQVTRTLFSSGDKPPEMLEASDVGQHWSNPLQVHF